MVISVMHALMIGSVVQGKVRRVLKICVEENHSLVDEPRDE